MPVEVVYLARADVRRAGSRTPPARRRGIRVGESQGLVNAITDRPETLTPAQVAVVATALRKELRTA